MLKGYVSYKKQKSEEEVGSDVFILCGVVTVTPTECYHCL
jgi:hypothetical protein